jgi:triosephosphate isomerase
MRRKIVAGNWKMNGSLMSNRRLLEELLAGYEVAPDVKWIVFPPFVYLSQCQMLLQDSGVCWGGQDVSEQECGAFTGDVAASMLKDLGARYVLTGHSERRSLHHETNQLVALKTQKALLSGLMPIVCVGETLEQRKKNETLAVIHDQLQAVFDVIRDFSLLDNMVIAYEPVWAIGTGQVATPEQAQAVHEAIRKQLSAVGDDLAEKISILYGGSVKPNNAAELFKMPDIDGALIGGASLKAEQFLAIGELCNQSS